MTGSVTDAGGWIRLLVTDDANVANGIIRREAGAWLTAAAPGSGGAMEGELEHHAAAVSGIRAHWVAAGTGREAAWIRGHRG